MLIKYYPDQINHTRTNNSIFQSQKLVGHPRMQADSTHIIYYTNHSRANTNRAHKYKIISTNDSKILSPLIPKQYTPILPAQENEQKTKWIKAKDLVTQAHYKSKVTIIEL